ncbi:PREDICTED: eugenol synthase 1-like isoform X2 [Lupinus angustifolius]|uniref:eugenol synthase 1-like isoform X2 n=1 Tax=Lupinus angustifolius TaxID=3871 RepID=UPI00092F3ED2|nr:PREDICTED: eugenol synthase 1-like isoform X2 [Lupinus angustifolius]
MESKKSRILVFGGTGYIGKYIVKASITLGHPTLVYTRPLNSQTPHSKTQICNEFNSMGVILVQRFLPSEFGVEEDRVNPLPPFQEFLNKKRIIRREIEASGIPYTFVSASCCGAYFVNILLRPYEKVHNISVYGNGETKAILNYEEDIAMYTIKVANDPRTCNRIVLYRPSKNIITQNELISLWEQKSGQNFHMDFVPEEEIIKLSKTLPPPQDIPISILHSIFVRGDLVNFEIGEEDLEASQLYPDYNYTSIDQLLDIFLVDPPTPAFAAFE